MSVFQFGKIQFWCIRVFFPEYTLKMWWNTNERADFKWLITVTEHTPVCWKCNYWIEMPLYVFLMEEKLWGQPVSFETNVWKIKSDCTSTKSGFLFGTLFVKIGPVNKEKHLQKCTWLLYIFNVPLTAAFPILLRAKSSPLRMIADACTSLSKAALTSLLRSISRLDAWAASKEQRQRALRLSTEEAKPRSTALMIRHSRPVPDSCDWHWSIAELSNSPTCTKYRYNYYRPTNTHCPTIWVALWNGYAR